MALILIHALFFFPAPGGLHPPANGRITAGHSVGTVKLGGSVEDFRAVFPPQPSIESSDDPCGDRVEQWLDFAFRGDSIYAIFKGGVIIQFAVRTPRFSLPYRIKVGADQMQVRRRYPKGRDYTLLRSGSAVVGGRDLNYWVEQSQGIAFELYWDRIRRRRFVSSIEVFNPSQTFRPQACVSDPQSFLLR